MESSAPLMLRIPDVCQRLNYTRSAVYEAMKAGDLKYVKLGKSRFVRESDLREYVENLPTAG